MAEMPDASENHGKPRGIGGADDVIVLDRSTGLDDGGSTRLRGLQQAIGKGKKSIGGHNGAMDKGAFMPCRLGRILALADGYAGRVNA